MPYSVNKLPDNLPSNYTTEQINVFISAANSALESGKDEGEAISVGIASSNDINKVTKGMNVEDNLIKNMLHTITSYLQGKEEKVVIAKVYDEDGNKIIKQEEDKDKQNIVVRSAPEQTIVKFNDEEMIAIEPLYTMPMESDLHGEGMSGEEISSMVENLNSNIDKITGNIGHVYDTDGFYFLKAWVNQCDCYIGKELVLEGQPIIKVQFTDEKLWSMRKSGTLQGLSIGALGHRIDNENYREEE